MAIELVPPVPSDNRIPLPPGTQLDDGRFEIASLLGRGGCALTYEAVEQSSGGQATRVVIKETFPLREPSKIGTRSGTNVEFRVDADKLMADRTANEGIFNLRVSEHPGIVRLLRSFYANSTGYLVVERIDGNTLFDEFAEQMPQPVEALRIYLELLSAVMYINRKQLAHRDITPVNARCPEHRSQEAQKSWKSPIWRPPRPVNVA